ncbi:hypothetical protein NHX12_010720 [Muraenolepis orangiensis]|uniref:Tyrosine-protein kinase n=1 Tax=Muraenolepis orangiensis TaxID=630683 RepID=A0A9Q0DIP4_9TELE|nr:hypothetical protein NHX12_010720 [Muraenolepis orangiensis]
MGECCPRLLTLCKHLLRVEDGAKVEREPEVSSIYKALYAFESRDEIELSIREGDVLRLVSREGDWWMVRKMDQDGSVVGSGFVPGNYLEKEGSVDDQPWYFGKMGRSEAQSHLVSPENQTGAFLIRRSENGIRDGEFYLNPGHVFGSLGDLVDFYQTNHLSTHKLLGQPCKRKELHPADLSRAVVDEWELPKEEFTLQEQLGTGCFAHVFRGNWKNRVSVAVKIIKNDSEMDHAEFQREVQILKDLRHPHLISLLAVCTASPPYYIITELMLKGSEGRDLDVESLIDMAAQVADGMSFLEQKKSIHRDLAARNVLVGENYICKVADFGLARIVKAPFYITDDRKIPYKWSAPEAISHGMFSNKSDVWSFGVLLYEIMTHGGVPYPAQNNRQAYEAVVSGYRMPSPPSCPDSIYSIMMECWQAEALQRPDFKELFVQLCTLTCDETQ